MSPPIRASPCRPAIPSRGAIKLMSFDAGQGARRRGRHRASASARSSSDAGQPAGIGPRHDAGHRSQRKRGSPPRPASGLSQSAAPGGVRPAGTRRCCSRCCSCGLPFLPAGASPPSRRGWHFAPDAAPGRNERAAPRVTATLAHARDRLLLARSERSCVGGTVALLLGVTDVRGKRPLAFAFVFSMMIAPQVSGAGVPAACSRRTRRSCSLLGPRAGARHAEPAARRAAASSW